MLLKHYHPWDDKSLKLNYAICTLTKEFCYYVGILKPALIFCSITPLGLDSLQFYTCCVSIVSTPYRCWNKKALI